MKCGHSARCFAPTMERAKEATRMSRLCACSFRFGQQKCYQNDGISVTMTGSFAFNSSGSTSSSVRKMSALP